MSPALAALVAGAAGMLGLAELALSALPYARSRAPRVAGGLSSLAATVARAGSEGRDPGARERRRLLAAGGAAGALAGLALGGPVPALALGAGGPWLAARLLRARREHYRRAVERGAPAMALALADALAGGHSLRGALAEAAAGVEGQAGFELRRVASELALGARTDAALDALRDRVRSPQVDTIVTACLVQRRAGGDLAGLLRDCAEAFGDEERLRGEVRAATAQARFTGVVVVLMPLAGAALAELASPGFLASLWSSFLTAWLVGIAAAMQVAAALCIRRLGRVRL